MADVTFRDFAAAIMQGNIPGAAGVLETLLGLPHEQATGASEHFKTRMADPAFMPKAMGRRTAITSGSDEEVGALLADCFGLDEAARPGALATLRAHYPS